MGGIMEETEQNVVPETPKRTNFEQRERVTAKYLKEMREALKRTKEPKKKEKELAPKKLELLVTIVNRHKAEFYQDLIQQFEVNMQMAMMARGTAAREILQILGLADNAKTVIFSVIKQDRIPDVKKALEEKFTTVNDGKGIAFTVPMTSVVGVAVYKFLTDNRKEVKEG